MDSLNLRSWRGGVALRACLKGRKDGAQRRVGPGHSPGSQLVERRQQSKVVFRRKRYRWLHMHRVEPYRPRPQARWGKPAHELPDDHPGWKLEARYLALGLATWVCTLSPERVVLGGGVMQHQQLFPMVRRELAELLNGYVRAKAILEEIDEYVVPPQLGKRAGVLGAMVLAEHVYRNPTVGVAAPLEGDDTWR